jgi:hypothetical protein
MSVPPRILVHDDPARGRLVVDSARAWRWIGWFSLVLTVVGVADWIIAWIPFRLGSPEWEFGTIVATFAGLPLVTMGMAGLLASGVASGRRWVVMSTGIGMLLLALFILAASIIFALDVPLAMRAVEGVARIGIMKAIAKSAVTGGLFLLVYVVGGVSAMRLALK